MSRYSSSGYSSAEVSYTLSCHPCYECKKQSRQKWLRVALHRQKWLHNKFSSGLGSVSLEGAMAETVSCYFLPWWSSWLRILTAMAQTSAYQQLSQLPLVSLKLSLILLSPAVTHEVQKHHAVCCGSSATVCMPRTQIKDLRVCCDFQLLEWSGSPSVCLLGEGRNSREDLQTWTLALSKRKGRKLRLVSPLHCFWVYSKPSLELVAQPLDTASVGFCIQGAEQPFCPQTAQKSSPLYVFLG